MCFCSDRFCRGGPSGSGLGFTVTCPSTGSWTRLSGAVELNTVFSGNVTLNATLSGDVDLNTAFAGNVDLAGDY